MAGLLDRRTDVLLEGCALLSPVGADLAEDLDLVVADVVVRQHHEREQLERCLVLVVGGGVYGNAAVEVVESSAHEGSFEMVEGLVVGRFGGGGGKRSVEEVELVEQQVLGDLFLGGHVGDADQGQHLVRAPSGEQGGRQLQRVSGDDVVVGESVDEQQRTGEVGGERQQGIRVVARLG